MSGEALLRMRGISRAFPGVKALDGVDFTLRAGEIHALMGENGAGKSTLIKVLTGVYPKDSGEIILGGRRIDPRSPLEAERAGIATVYQEVNLIPELSVAENILLGRQPKRGGFLRWREIRRRAGDALERLGLEIDSSQPVSSYSMAIQQMVAIARALSIEAKLVVLDEPTSSLDEKEVAELFAIMRRLAGEGLGIIFVTHFLDQVYEITDRVTVLRNGRLAGAFTTADLSRFQLIATMLGKEVAEVENVGATLRMNPATGMEAGPVILRAKGVGRAGGVDPFDLEIRRGEVVGLAGLLGSGRTEAARLLFGADRRTSGAVEINGRAAALDHPAEAIACGVGFCSEDRKSEGILPALTVRENIILAMQASRGALRKLPVEKQIEIAEHYIEALKIKTPSPETPIENLSGGNQQKVLLARWLCLQPDLIILDEPTRGIDVGAKGEIEKLVESLRKDGMAILFISSELEEVARACNRVAVMRDRRKIGELEGTEVEEHRIMELIAAHEE